MEAALKLEPAGSVVAEIERLRTIFTDAFPSSACELLPHEELAAQQEASAAEDPLPDRTYMPNDWAVTLGNIRLLVTARKDAEARLRDVEERALRAEARAEEAEHWLRRLHQAVLEGLPAAAQRQQ